MAQQTFDHIKKSSPAFFLGANSGKGFVNHFSECYRPEKGEKLYIIKGGPGTGKSTFMKELIVTMKKHNVDCELYFCSSDPQSLDGVRFPSLGVALVDGTSPHSMDPQMLGIGEEIINLGEFLHSEELNREEVVPLYRQNGAFHKKASRYLGAASRLMEDSYGISCNGCDFNKVEQTAMRFCREFFTDKKRRGEEYKRFLSAFTPKGHLLFEDTLARYADTIVAVEDEYGGVSSVFLTAIYNQALANGYEVLVCLCAMSPERKIDHVIVPELQLAFCTTNWFMPLTVDTSRRIHARRFYDMEYIAQYKHRLRFNRRASEELLDGACQNLQEAKKVHDVLEEQYIKAMDFEGCNQVRQALEKKLLCQ